MNCYTFKKVFTIFDGTYEGDTLLTSYEQVPGEDCTDSQYQHWRPDRRRDSGNKSGCVADAF